jgi:hypothetical protein
MRNIMNKVIKIKYQQGYIFNIVFDDGTCGNVDFSEYIGKWPIFEALRDLNLFKAARVDGGTIARSATGFSPCRNVLGMVASWTLRRNSNIRGVSPSDRWSVETNKNELLQPI